MKSRPILRGLVLIAVLAAIGYALKRWDLFSHLNQAWIDTEVRGHGFRGELLFVGLGAIATSIGVPRQVVSFLGGYAFGFLFGTGLAVLATLLGCILTVTFAHVAGRSLIRGRLTGRTRRIGSFLAAHPFSMTVMIRLMPVGNNMVTNLVAGVSRVPVIPFFGASLIGYVPQSAIFALIGSGVDVDSVRRIAIGTVLFVASALIGLRLLGRYREFGEAVDSENAPEDVLTSAPDPVHPHHTA